MLADAERICSTCESCKNIDMFVKDNRCDKGHSYLCKACANVKTRTYFKTKRGMVVKIYEAQKSSAKARGMDAPRYTKDELHDWLYSQSHFHELYDTWVRSRYAKALVPSVDRINDSVSYIFSNIQLMTWENNNIKGYMGNRKQVAKYTPCGVLLRYYTSIKEAARVTDTDRIGIANCCSGYRNQKLAGGFMWKYK